MAGNLVLIQPNPNPYTFCVAASESVTAGAFVKTEAGNDVATSSASAGAMSDLASSDLTISECNTSGDENTAIGICGEDGSAGAFVKVYTQGFFLVRAGEAITAGALIQKTDSTDPYEVSPLAAINNNSEEQEKIGRAISGASAADKYIVAHLNFS